jgi:cellulose biosynthesis protein BcsQ
LSDEIIIYVGSFGSGKTEIAINHSLKELQNKNKAVIVDLDIVNPYFRSREIREELKELDIKVIAPPGKYAMADIPLISPEIKGAIQDSGRILILDVGGDDVGAKSLASFYPILKNTDYQMNLVINPYRPFTKNHEEIKKMLQEIEVSSRLKVNGLISNPNLGLETNVDLIIKGHKIVEEVSTKLSLPIKFLVIEQKIFQKSKDYPEFRDNYFNNIFIIKRFMELPWDKSTDQGLFKN